MCRSYTGVCVIFVAGVLLGPSRAEAPFRHLHHSLSVKNLDTDIERINFIPEGPRVKVREEERKFAKVNKPRTPEDDVTYSSEVHKTGVYSLILHLLRIYLCTYLFTYLCLYACVHVGTSTPVHVQTLIST